MFVKSMCRKKLETMKFVRTNVARTWRSDIARQGGMGVPKCSPPVIPLLLIILCPVNGKRCAFLEQYWGEYNKLIGYTGTVAVSLDFTEEVHRVCAFPKLASASREVLQGTCAKVSWPWTQVVSACPSNTATTTRQTTNGSWSSSPPNAPPSPRPTN